MTGEHVWDSWLTEVYANERNLSGFTFRDYDGDRNLIRDPYTSPGIDKQIKVVCGECNSTWMSDITGAVKGLMKDAIVHRQPTVLSPADCQTIARFLFLKSVVIDQMKVNQRPRFYRDSIRWGFRATRALPSGIQVWMSQFHSTAAEGEVWAVYSKPNSGPLVGCEFFTMTYHVGYLMLQFVGFKWLNRAERNRPLPFLTQADFWKPVCVEIWPSKNINIAWPTGKFLDAAGRINFNRRWKQLRTPV